MYPILFRVGDAALQTYMLAMSLAYFVGLWVWAKEIKRLGVSTEVAINISIFTFLVGLLGARAFFVSRGRDWGALGIDRPSFAFRARARKFPVIRSGSAAACPGD